MLRICPNCGMWCIPILVMLVQTVLVIGSHGARVPGGGGSPFRCVDSSAVAENALRIRGRSGVRGCPDLPWPRLDDPLLGLFRC